MYMYNACKWVYGYQRKYLSKIDCMRFLALHAPTTTAPVVNVPTSIHRKGRSEKTKNELVELSSISISVNSCLYQLASYLEGHQVAG